MRRRLVASLRAVAGALEHAVRGVAPVGWLYISILTLVAAFAFAGQRIYETYAGGPEPAVGLYWTSNTDPNVGPGVCAPMWQLLWRTDVPSVYYKSGTSCTAWTLAGTAAGGGGGTVTSVGCGADLSCSPSPITGAGTIAVASIADQRLYGNVSGSLAAPAALTGTQATTLLDAFTSTLKGLAPASGGGTANFLRADGSWATPPGTGTTGGGATGDLAAWASASSLGNYAGSSPTACTAGNVMTNVTESAAGALSPVCTAIGTAGGVTGTGTANQVVKFTGPTAVGNAWPTDDGTTWGVSGKFTITEGTGAASAQEADLAGTVTATATSGTINNWDPAGTGNLNGISIVREAPTAALTLTGMVAGHAGQIVILRNASSTAANTITVNHLNGGSTAANQFTLVNSASAVVAANGACALRYSGTSSTWEPISGGCASTITTTPNATITVTDTGTVNDYNPPGLSSASIIIFNNASQLIIQGLSGGQDGRTLTLCGINAAVNFVQENTGSSAANRFNLLGATNAALSVAGALKPSCTQLIYLGGSINRWTQPSLASSQSLVPGYTFSAVVTANASENLQGSLQFSGVAHIRTATIVPPTVTSCGTGATIVGGDSMMTVTTGTGATGCTITFGNSSWGSNHPACIVYPEGGAAFPATSYGGTATLVLGAGTTAATSYDIHCLGTN